MDACLFDIDGTLLSSGGAGKHAMYAAIRSVFGIDEVLDGVPFAGRTDRAIARDLFALHAIQDSDANWQGFMAGYLGHLPGSLVSGQGRVLPGVCALLERLAQRGDVAVGLLTGNMRDGARTKLEHFGLYHHFGFGGYGDEDLDRDCVARRAIGALERHAGRSIDPARVWVVGDTPLDIRCARSVGARVLAVATGQHTVEQLAAERPDVVLPDLCEASRLAVLWE